eukprot:26023-Pelagococcus_subviridis.AAC.1
MSRAAATSPNATRSSRALESAMCASPGKFAAASSYLSRALNTSPAASSSCASALARPRLRLRPRVEDDRLRGAQRRAALRRTRVVERGDDPAGLGRVVFYARRRRRRRERRRLSLLLRARVLLALLRDARGALGFLEDVHRALEQPRRVDALARAKFHDGPLPKRLRARPRSTLRVQQRGAVQPPRALGVSLQQLEPRPLLPQRRDRRRLGRSLIEELARRLRPTRAHEIPHELPLHDAAALVFYRLGRVAEGLVGGADAAGGGRRRQRRRRHRLRLRLRRRRGRDSRRRGRGRVRRRGGDLKRARARVRVRDDELRVDDNLRDVRRRNVRVLVLVLRVQTVVVYAREAAFDRRRGRRVRPGQRSEHLHARAEPRKLLRADASVVVRVQHLDELVRRAEALALRATRRGRGVGVDRLRVRQPHVVDHPLDLVSRDDAIAVEVEHAEHPVRVRVRVFPIRRKALLREGSEPLRRRRVRRRDELRERVRGAGVFLEPALVRRVRGGAHLRRRVHRRRADLELHPPSLSSRSRSRSRTRSQSRSRSRSRSRSLRSRRKSVIVARFLRVLLLLRALLRAAAYAADAANAVVGPVRRQLQRAVQAPVPVRLGPLQIILRPPRHDVEHPVRDLLRAVARRERASLRGGALDRAAARRREARAPDLRRHDHPHPEQIVHLLPRLFRRAFTCTPRGPPTSVMSPGSATSASKSHSLARSSAMRSAGPSPRSHCSRLRYDDGKSSFRDRSSSSAHSGPASSACAIGAYSCIVSSASAVRFTLGRRLECRSASALRVGVEGGRVHGTRRRTSGRSRKASEAELKGVEGGD